MTATTDPLREALLFDALYAETPPEGHSQLCPVWTRRRYPAKAKACDCWVEDQAHRRARRLEAALSAQPAPQPLDAERLATALIASDLMRRYIEYADVLPTMTRGLAAEDLAPQWAEAITREYAALQPPDPEAVR